MRYEINRLNSFTGRWPLTYVKPKDLAKSGFFYLQSEDKVQCTFCRVIKDDWNVGQKPLKEHIKLSPKCSFLLSSNTSNVPIVQPHHEPDLIINASKNTYKPKVPRMCTFKARLKSFKFWPMISISIQKLADCGFFYTGYGTPCEDEVTCFFCGLSLGNWEHGDDPLIEHDKFSPNCNYLSIKIDKKQDTSKEHEFINEACKIFSKSLVEKVATQHFKETNTHYTSYLDLYEEVLRCSGNDLVKNTPTRKGPTNDNLLCKICMDHTLDIVFEPCRHLCSCFNCAQNMQTCPICRMFITERIKTFLV